MFNRQRGLGASWPASGWSVAVLPVAHRIATVRLPSSAFLGEARCSRARTPQGGTDDERDRHGAMTGMYEIGIGIDVFLDPAEVQQIVVLSPGHAGAAVEITRPGPGPIRR